jgi:hypothetical protein
MISRRCFLLTTPVPVFAAPQWEDIFGRVLGRGNDRIALGLKEALSVGRAMQSCNSASVTATSPTSR